MRRLSTCRFLLMLAVSFILLVGLLPTQGQAANLLENPGLEQPFQELEGAPPPVVAAGWTPWYNPPTDEMSVGQNVQPEYAPASADAEPQIGRIRAGEDAQKIFAIFSTFDGGIYQRVTSGIEPGTELRFTIYAWVWSSNREDLPDESDEDADVTVEVGIDPTGGTDPASDLIVWSLPAEQYDNYRPYSVNATATTNAVTVYVRTTISGEPKAITAVYLDEAELVSLDAGETVVEVTTEPGSETVTEEATEDVGIIVAAPTQEIAAPTQESVAATATEAPAVVSVTETATQPIIPLATATVEQDFIIATNTLVVEPTVPPTDLPLPTDVPTEIPLVPTSTSVPTEVPVVPTDIPTETPLPPTDVPTATLLPTEPPTAVAQAQSAEPETDSDNAAQSAEGTQEAIGGPVQPLNETFPNTIIHTVRRGDIVADLAVLYGSTTEAIIQANGLNENALIYVGQGLIIPVRLPPPATVTPTPTALVVVVTATAAADAPPATLAPGGTGGPIGGVVGQTPGLVYVVQFGDTLSGIAGRFNTTVTALAQLNGIVNVNRIQSGQRLIIPATGGQPVPTNPAVTATPLPTVQTYMVRYGDTLFRLAAQFNVNVNALIDTNGIANPNRIYVGQVLIIPPGAR
ncbi:MAG: LysM peptidoglycan-binding domain-containing protein [bacterium]|nr:LysM peptidoglycan-binding domain-containing protein [bacterium]